MNYRLSIMRAKGWSRIGFVGAAVMLPITGMQYALGIFSEGLRGLEQAAEYFASGAVAALIIGFSARWVLHGFAVRATRDSDEDEGESHEPRGSGVSRPPARSRN